MPKYYGTGISQGMRAAEERQSAAIDKGLERQTTALDIADKRLRLQDLQDEIKVNPRTRRAEARKAELDADKAYEDVSLARNTAQAKVDLANAEADIAEIQAATEEDIRNAEARKNAAEAAKDEAHARYYDSEAQANVVTDYVGTTTGMSADQKAKMFRQLPDSSQSTIMKRSATLTTDLYKQTRDAENTMQQAALAIQLYDAGVVETGATQPFFDAIGSMAADVPGLGWLITTEWYREKYQHNNK